MIMSITVMNKILALLQVFQYDYHITYDRRSDVGIMKVAT